MQSSSTPRETDPVPAVQLFLNPTADSSAPYGDAGPPYLTLAAAAVAAREISSWPGYHATPLREPDDLAAQAGVNRVWYKDESERFGLNSFKALGGAYGVLRVLQSVLSERLGGDGVSSASLRQGRKADTVADITVTCATDGNHGRSVAWAAQMFGCRAIVYIPQAASANRERAIATHGAMVVRTDGDYDAAVRQADKEARANGWHVVSDTSYPGYEHVPVDVMQGYSILVSEILEQLPRAERPTHVFIQAGVGGLAAAVCAHLWETLGSERPVFVVVEPLAAACCLATARAGRLTTVPNAHDTIMACLAAGEMSPVAWSVLKHGTDAFIAIADEYAERSMRMLAGLAHPIVAGESGAGGLAGLLAAMESDEVRSALELDADSRVLLFGTEGATDPEIYERIVGRSPDSL
ncbi:MAG: diaminopropionate ammonia-lyase [Gemmatimonadales bacterium]